MKYIISHSNDPAFNIAQEAYAFREMLDEDEIFILWINEPTIVIGKHQNAIEEINKEYTDAHDIHVVRRLSGGVQSTMILIISTIPLFPIKQMKGLLILKPFQNQLLIL